MFYVYMLRCADQSYYVGHTDNIDIRLAAHNSGSIRGYTANRRPVQIVWCETFGTRDEAFICERRIKGWSRAKKEALIREDWAGLQVLSRNRTESVSSGLARPSTGSG